MQVENSVWRDRTGAKPLVPAAIERGSWPRRRRIRRLWPSRP